MDEGWVVVTDEWTERCKRELAALSTSKDPIQEFFVLQKLVDAAPPGVSWGNAVYKSLLDRWVLLAQKCRNA